MTRKTNAIVNLQKSLLCSSRTEVVSLDGIWIGQQAGFSLKTWVKLTGDIHRLDVPLSHSPYTSFLAAIMADEGLLDDEGFLYNTDYYQMAKVCMDATGNYMGAKSPQQLKAWLSEYYSMFKVMKNGTGSTRRFSSSKGHSKRNSPIILKERGKTDMYEIVDGHHRLAIAWLLGKKKITAKVLSYW